MTHSFDVQDDFLGHADIVSMLLNNFPGIDVDQPNHQGFTALMKAAVQGRSKCAKLLLYSGMFEN